MKETRVTFTKRDAKKQIVYGVVYEPMVPDSQGDFMTAEDIAAAAHTFLSKGLVNAIDTEHNLMKNGSAVVESFVAREGDPDFPADAWVLGTHVPDKKMWAKVENNDIGGYSMFGTGRRVPTVVELEIPDDGVIFGQTMEQGNHAHAFAAEFNDKGQFVGGETIDGNHSHVLRKGTVSEPGGPDGHRHRWNMMEALRKSYGPMTPSQKKYKAKKGKVKCDDMTMEDH